MTSDITIYTAQRIITMNPGQPNAEAVAVRDDKILAVGSRAEVSQVSGEAARIVDLGAKTVAPGFIETHSHLQVYGAVSQYLDLFPWTTHNLENLLAKIRNAQPLEDGWIVGWGFDPWLYEDGRSPTREELDQARSDVPVYVYNMSGHLAYANSRALELAGITRDTPDPEGGRYEKGTDGELNGTIVAHSAMFAVVAPPAIGREAVYHGAQAHSRAGITTVVEPGLLHAGMLAMYQDVTQQDDWPVRVVAALALKSPAMRAMLQDAGSGKWDTEKLQVTYGKIWVDGSIQGGTVLLSEHTRPHFRHPNPDEVAYTEYDELMTQVLEIYQAGLSPAIHTNADGAVDWALDAIERAQNQTGRHDLHPQLIHVQVVRDEQLQRMKDLGVGATFFTPHVYFFGEKHKNDLWTEEWANRIDPMKTAFDIGVHSSMHNDAPVSAPNPLQSLWVAVNRLTSAGNVLGPEQRITPEQALAAYTSEAAIQLGYGEVIGTLEAGKYADMVLLSEDPLQVDPLKIKDIRVEATMMGGKVFYLQLEESFTDVLE
jgi:predicted amidohydrolase YtcJ